MRHADSRMARRAAALLLGAAGLACAARESAGNTLVTLPAPTLEFELPIDEKTDRRGGIIAHDLDGDSRFDFLVTYPGVIVAAAADGRILWRKQLDVQISEKAETNGLPGHHAPGVQAADVTGDARVEVLYLTRSGYLEIIDGASGELVRRIRMTSPQGTERWEHLVVANFRGEGDRDILLQATNKEGYRLGRFIAAYSIADLLNADAARPPAPLWQRDDFIAAAHNGARVADLDGDGRDAVISGSIVDADGRKLLDLPVRGHIDAVAIADVRPDLPGLEVVALEETRRARLLASSNRIARWVNFQFNRYRGEGQRVFVFGGGGMIWARHYMRSEPQNVAVGRFGADSKELQLWCRSRFRVDQKPFVFDARGEIVSAYELSDTAPADWPRAGVEVPVPIHWSGTGQQLMAAKARHQDRGDVAIIDPLSGRFEVRAHAEADRLYVADISGDWREELVVLSANRIRIYSNPLANPHPHRVRLWSDRSYRRAKQTWNYYSP